MLAVFAVVLALAGAPASTPVVCSTHMGHTDGLTHFDATGNPVSIEVRENLVCAAARFAAANRQVRNQMAAAPNRTYIGGSFAELLGSGLRVLLHEAEHVALRTTNECQVEKAAMRKLPELLERFAPRLAPAALQSAMRDHRHLPANYRDC